MKREQYPEVNRSDAGHLKARLLSLSPKKRALLRRQLAIRRGHLPSAPENHNRRLVAYVVSHSNQSLTPSDLRSYLRERLPEYMVPSAYVYLESLPLTPNGKLDRRALSALDDHDYVVPGYEPPVGETETRLARIWADALGRERVGRHDNFFELGGHSLLAMRVVSKSRQLEIAISIIDLLKHPTIESLASHVRSRKNDLLEESVAIPLRIGGIEPPLFLVHEVSGGVFYGQRLVPHLAPGFPVYGLPAPGPFEEPLQTIQAMATRMVQMIRTSEPCGPYRIAGWSFGATLAYEVANQLLRDGASVEFLGSLDGGYFGPGTEAPLELPLDHINLLLNVYQHDMERFPRLKALADENSSFDALVQAGQEQSLITTELSVDEMRGSLNRYRSHVLAASNYTAYSLPIPLYLFAAEDAEPGSDVSPLRNWEMVMPVDNIRLIIVPGNHRSMMWPPNIASLGEMLSRALRQARETSLSL